MVLAILRRGALLQMARIASFAKMDFFLIMSQGAAMIARRELARILAWPRKIKLRLSWLSLRIILKLN